MKTIILLVCLVALSQQGIWDDWHLSTWNTNPTIPSQQSSYANWTHNTPASPASNPAFSNYQWRLNQYMFYNSNNQSQYVLCRPKYYIYNDYLCAKDPAFWGTSADEYCLSNVYGSGTYPVQCDQNHPLYNTFDCCYDTTATSGIKFLFAFDTYATSPGPLF
jgi:hypothetical protein